MNRKFYFSESEINPLSKLYKEQIENLENYRGVGDPPADYDAYWDRAKAELNALPISYELAEPEFHPRGCKAYNLYFTGAGGAKIHCQLLIPKNIKGKMPGVAMFHGYWTNIGDWSSKLGYVEEGFCVLAMDVRGQGGESEDNGVYRKGNTQSGHIIRGLESENPDNMFYRNVFLDAAQTAKILMSFDFVDENNVFATGASQGGALTVACASLVPSLKGAAPVYPFLCDFRGIYKFNFDCPCYEEITWYFRQRDPLHRKEDFFFDRLGYIDLKNRTKDIKCDVLWTTALMDKVCPPFSQMAAYNGITSNKQRVFFPEYGHEYLPYSGDYILEFFESLL
ncbi:Cephalosporin-C deacetylase [[Clostridium] cellulosi]|uniref:Cephalosporin-C deacetylase n=1 Tax=[Clostridium] cellulosi TaxID=29343 RepID=A0A078KRH9_9FIRM|nr:Cephalosporin-C deacetylase [[Clostridium] cellulosi]